MVEGAQEEEQGHLAVGEVALDVEPVVLRPQEAL